MIKVNLIQKLKKAMLILVGIVLILFISGCIFMNQAKFGKHPSGKRLELVKQSPNWRDGAFQNLSPTPALTEGVSFFKVFTQFFFGKKIDVKPTKPLPSEKVDLLHLDSTKDVLVWFGHSSYFLQLDGITFLVDPVLSGSASPVSFTTNAFAGTDRYKVEDLPKIDFLLITHDHWDHLDYETVLQLKSKVDQIVCSLGTGEHLEYWGFDTAKISEKDWNETVKFPKNITIHTAPARHFSGRGFKRNQALWTSYILEVNDKRIFIGGDSGYDSHFKQIGEKFKSFDLAILENGQYNKNWKYIHMMPDEVLKAAKELNTKILFPVHSSKFALATHPWYEPLETITSLPKDSSFILITPKIGSIASPTDSTQVFDSWWR
jgi:L-ascorbate metabolism protein UlaG (beta-lactamase superfamily)